MKTNKDSLRDAMDRRLSFLDDVPSCRSALLYRIAQEEAPVMKKKISVGFVFAAVMILLSVAALAAGLLITPRVSAARTADLALEREYGITAEMQTFFAREEKEEPDGGYQVTYTGAGSLEYVLGVYTAQVKDGTARVTWSREGEDTSGGYDADAWGIGQLKQMMADSKKDNRAYMEKAQAAAERHGTADGDEEASEADEHYHEKREAAKTAALKARKLTEEEMVTIGREFIVTNYGLNEEQTGRMELYTELGAEAGNSWYETVNGQPCFEVEYLLYTEYTTEQMEKGEPRTHTEKDGYYKVFVNVESGAVEQFEYNSALGGLG